MLGFLKRASKGQVLVIAALAMVALFGIAALAVDVGMAYGVKAKLNAAADAAAIAALRERTSGRGSESSAVAVATTYFNANFPAQTMGVPAPTCEITIASRDEAFVASVTATTVMPTHLAKLIGWRGLTVSAKSEATRSSLDVALVLDTTQSLQSVFPTVKGRAMGFVDRFSESYDRVALVPFASGVGLQDAGGELLLTDGEEIKKAARGFSRVGVKNKISRLEAQGMTASDLGMRIGLYQLNKVRNPAARRAIVFFSDGAPNGFTGNAPIDAAGHTVSGNIYSGIYDYETPKVYRPDDRKGITENVALYKVPVNSGGNRIGSVTLLPELPVNNRERPINFYTSSTPREVRCDANKAARNALENIAAYARSQGIAVFSLGYGERLDQRETSIGCSTDNEVGATIMKRIANTADSDTYNPTQPTGIYCHAATTEQLGPCFDAIANAVLRLTK